MRKISYLLFMLILFGCSKEQPSKGVSHKKSELSQVVLIFKEPKFIDTIFYGKSSFTVIPQAVSYNFEGSFLAKTLELTKSVTDTFILKTDNPIYLAHKSGLNYENVYKFSPRDTAIFYYVKSLPYLKINGKQSGLNAISDFYLNNPLDTDEMAFFMKHNRFKNASEKRTDSFAIATHQLKFLKFLDSLKRSGIITNEEYKIANLSNLNFRSLKEKHGEVILSEKFNLALPSNQNLLISAFQKVHKPKLIAYSQGHYIDYVELFRKANEMTSIESNNKKYLTFYYLNQIAQVCSQKDFQESFSIFSKTESSLAYINYFKNRYPKMFTKTKVGKSDIELKTYNSVHVSLHEVLRKNRGKFVFVDFWASWCAPCREAFPSSKKLRDKFRQVSFVYISVDEDASQWRKACEKENLNKFNESYLATNFPNDIFFKSIELNSIPRYILFDKGGKLINQNAPAPDSKELEELLKSLEN